MGSTTAVTQPGTSWLSIGTGGIDTGDCSSEDYRRDLIVIMASSVTIVLIALIVPHMQRILSIVLTSTAAIIQKQTPVLL